MEYLSSDHPAFEIHLSCDARFKTRASPEVIAEELVSQSQCISRKMKTSRSMWPNEELIGVEFERDQPHLTGKLTASKVSLGFRGFDGFEGAYTTVAEWCADAPFELPPREDFLVQSGRLLVADEDAGAVLDETKFGERNFIGSVGYDGAGVQASYDDYRGCVFIHLEDGVPRSQFRQHVEQLLREERVVIAPAEQIDNDHPLYGGSNERK